MHRPVECLLGGGKGFSAGVEVFCDAAELKLFSGRGVEWPHQGRVSVERSAADDDEFEILRGGVGNDPVGVVVGVEIIFAQDDEIGGVALFKGTNLSRQVDQPGGVGCCHEYQVSFAEGRSRLGLVPEGGVVELAEQAVAAGGAPVGGECDVYAGSFGGGDVGGVTVKFDVAAGRPDEADTVSGHFSEARGCDGDAMDERDARAQKAPTLEHGELACCGCVVRRAFAEVDEERAAWMGAERYIGFGERFGAHLEGEDVVDDLAPDLGRVRGRHQGCG